MRRQVAIEKIAEWTLTDEANAGGVFFRGIGQAELMRNIAHLGFRHFTQRKQGFGQLRLIQTMQKVALVFARVQTFEQLIVAIHFAHARIVAGGDQLRAEAHGVVEKGFEFDFGVAQHVGIRGASCAVFAQKFGKYAVFVFGGEVDRFDVHTDGIGDRCGINPVLPRGAVLGVVIVFPVFHEKTDDLVTLLFEQPRGDG